MYGWRETTNNLTPHEGSVIYDRSALAIEFGPTLAQFVSTLELSPIRFASSSRSEEERENGEIWRKQLKEEDEEEDDEEEEEIVDE